MAKIFQKTVNDNVLILGTRESATQPFQAPDWIDLRMGMFLSLTKAANDDDPSALGETIAQPSSMVSPPEDRVWIGFKDSGADLPTARTGVVFIGFGNAFPAPPPTRGESILSSSDIAVGTTNAYYWRPRNSLSNQFAALVTDGGISRAHSQNGIQQHFPQDVANAGGYCVLLGLRLTRPNPASHIITTLIKTNGVWSADMLYTSTPTKELLESNLDPWPTQVQQLGPATLSSVPDSLFAYWPFHNSRLRIHAWGIMKVA